VTPPRSARDEAGPRGEAAPRAYPPAPEPLPGDALDAHCHLGAIERPVAEVLATARAARVTRVITVGVDVPTSRWSAACAAENEGVYAAVAIHPNEIPAAATPAQRDSVLAEIERNTDKLHFGPVKFIVDGSIFPTMPTVNPVVATFTVGERAADLIRQRNE